VSRKRVWLLALAVPILVFGAVAALVIASGRSLVVIHNRSGAPLNLSVETTRPGQFSWEGELDAGGRVIRTARFSENSFVVVCRDEAGIHRTRGGHVSSGAPHRVDIVANGCASLKVDAASLP
jgi:uncharacterized protein (DUF2249 family)